MKNDFPEYSKKGEDEIKNIWENGIIVFDANALLNLYRYSGSTRQTIMQVLSKLSDRIWLPHQAALEYSRNRYEVIADQEKAYKEFMERVNQLQVDLQSSSKPPFFTSELHVELELTFSKVKSEVEHAIKRYKDYFNEDPIFTQLCSLVEGKIGAPFTEEILKELYKTGEDRYRAKIPPGYEDERNKDGVKMFGDLILWKQIISKSKADKKSVILVTDERKTDWWWKIKDGRVIGPRHELVVEIMKEAGTQFHMYSSERFLEYGQIYLNEKINQDALSEIQALNISELDSDNRQKAARNVRVSSELTDDISSRLNDLKNLSMRIEQVEKDIKGLENNLRNGPQHEKLTHIINVRLNIFQEELEFLKIQRKYLLDQFD